jgi:hypothetical protein
MEVIRPGAIFIDEATPVEVVVTKNIVVVVKDMEHIGGETLGKGFETLGSCPPFSG